MSEQQASNESQKSLAESLLGLVGAELETEPKAEDILDFTHNLFAHDSYNSPESLDPFTILQNGRAGQKMRCVEYSILAAGLLNAFGTPARVVAGLALSTDGEDEFSGHVFIEYWQDKWIMSDVQWGITPAQDGNKLSAQEMWESLETDQPIDFVRYNQIRAGAVTSDDEYRAWISPYTDVFDTPGVVDLSRHIPLAEHIARFRNSLPKNDAIAARYHGPAGARLTKVTSQEFYAPPQ